MDQNPAQELLSTLRQADTAEAERRRAAEASRRANIFLHGGGLGWIGLILWVTGPEMNQGTFASLVEFPYWPDLYGVVILVTGLLTVAFRKNLGWANEVLILLGVVWYLVFSGVVVGTWTAWHLGIGPATDEPGLLLAGGSFTLCLYGLKIWQSLREARKEDKAGVLT